MTEAATIAWKDAPVQSRQANHAARKVAKKSAVAYTMAEWVKRDIRQQARRQRNWHGQGGQGFHA
jgi:hypothetical protein